MFYQQLKAKNMPPAPPSQTCIDIATPPVLLKQGTSTGYVKAWLGPSQSKGFSHKENVCRHISDPPPGLTSTAHHRYQLLTVTTVIGMRRAGHNVYDNRTILSEVRN
jgi:hypothetical protein